MVITVASGKGGTGKTLIATNLAVTAARSKPFSDGREIWLADCDVEAPNDALFIHPKIESTRAVKRLIPEIDPFRCDGCGRCGEVCTYNAIAVARGKTILFKELCHACGACAALCPTGAISERAETVGQIESGQAGNLRFTQGILEIGFSSPVPVIRDMKKWVAGEAPNERLVIRDASPGTACPVVECLRDSDFALLVTEPTPFGLHDLKLVSELVLEVYRMSCGVVINKSNGEDRLIMEFCEEKGIPILMRVPLSRKIAETYSRGALLIDEQPEYQNQFIQLLERITETAAAHQRER